MILNHIQVCEYNEQKQDNETSNGHEMSISDESMHNGLNEFQQKGTEFLYDVFDPLSSRAQKPLTLSPTLTSASPVTLSPFYQTNELCEIATTLKVNNLEDNVEESKEVVKKQARVPRKKTKQANRREKKQVHSRKGKFTEDDDKLLKELVNKHGRDWLVISKGMPGKDRKQVKERYDNFLSKKLNRKKFSLKEDEKIMKLIDKIGPKFYEIAKELNGRSPIMVKNRYYSKLKKKDAPIS